MQKFPRNKVEIGMEKEKRNTGGNTLRNIEHSSDTSKHNQSEIENQNEQQRIKGMEDIGK